MKMRTSIKRWILCCAMGLGLLSATGAQEVWERLTDYEKPKNAEEQRAWDLIKVCRHQGSEGARGLIAQMQRIPHKYRKNALGALSRIQCQETRDYLLSLALSSSDTYAAIVYLENSGDSFPARKLLNSTNREIQALALHGLLGRSGMGPVILDRRAWEVTKDMLGSENLEHRLLATRVTASNSGAVVAAEEKAKALVASMLTTLTSPEAQKESAYSGSGWWYPFPLGEGVLAEQALALVEMKGVTKELLATLTPTQPGLVREGLVITRFIAGDQSVRGDLHRILTNSSSGRLRMAALDGGRFRTVTEAERACLETMAAADPLEGKPGPNYALVTGDHSLEDVRDAKIYPARILAEMKLKRLGPPKPKP